MHQTLTSYIAEFRRLLEEHFERTPEQGENVFALKGTPDRHEVLAGVFVEVNGRFEFTCWARVDTPELYSATLVHRNFVVVEDDQGARWAWEDYGDPVAVIEAELERLPVPA